MPAETRQRRTSHPPASDEGADREALGRWMLSQAEEERDRRARLAREAVWEREPW